ncbi:hypothetical protein [Paenibacillus contaminans]|uniref:hypothetical protein n=1 Tax=Paenibacillus contaminans TaxID=450362 RepID=UPI001EE14656
MVEYLTQLPDWDIIGVSRRGAESYDKVRYIPVDLPDEADTQKKLGGLTEVTHIFYDSSYTCEAQLYAMNILWVAYYLSVMKTSSLNLSYYLPIRKRLSPIYN